VQISFAACVCAQHPRNIARDRRLFSQHGDILGQTIALCGLSSAHTYLVSKIKVGATPDTVENPVVPAALNQLEQPCTFPRYECG